MERPWVTHYDPGVPSEIEDPGLTLPGMFQRTAELYPRRVATIFHHAKVTYGDMWRQIERFATGLRELGVQPGDRVAVMLPNLPQYLVAFFGALRAGAVVVPTNPLYTQHELEYQLADAGATVIVTLDQLFWRVQAALPSTEIRAVILTDVGAALPTHLRPLFAVKQRREGVRMVPSGGIVHRFAEVLKVAGVPTPVSARPDDLAVLQYTGGTTGFSKGAMLTHRNLVINAQQVVNWQGTRQGDEVRILCAVPFFHVYGLTVAMNNGILAGATLILMPRFIPKEVAATAQKYRPHFFPGVPTMYVALTHLPGFSNRQFGSLQACISGAAALPPDVQRAFQEVSGARLVEGYGLTEASPVTHCNPVMGGGQIGTIGVPFPSTEAKITDPDTWEDLPSGEVGELTVRGPQVMRGYWNRPEETADILRDGWLHTGDLATVDTDGFFRIVDRKKDMIIAGGFNVYPREVEDVLYSHPAIKEAAVFGVPHEYRGETVIAAVVPKEGRQATAEEIISFCRRHLAVYKAPTIVMIRQELPKSLVGKVLRRTLREEWEGDQEQTRYGKERQDERERETSSHR
ncbi:MAG: long-chain fatty acid--CoA ligase [Chloroflexota bacterium]|nr:long-chain fatty acid--CoA ligase [Chloroflexota bacterium]